MTTMDQRNRKKGRATMAMTMTLRIITLLWQWPLCEASLSSKGRKIPIAPSKRVHCQLALLWLAEILMKPILIFSSILGRGEYQSK